MIRLIVRPLAEADIDEAFAWYESRSVGLGVDFPRAVDDCLASIEASPLAYPIVHRNVRRTLLRRFPYAMLFVVDADRVQVIACVHTKRHQRRWRQRV